MHVGKRPYIPILSHVIQTSNSLYSLVPRPHPQEGNLWINMRVFGEEAYICNTRHMRNPSRDSLAAASMVLQRNELQWHARCGSPPLQIAWDYLF